VSQHPRRFQLKAVAPGLFGCSKSKKNGHNQKLSGAFPRCWQQGTICYRSLRSSPHE
jgi:hypothetical protein